MILTFVDWNPDPTIFEIFGFPVRWYGLCFAMAFLAGFQVLSYIFKKEGRPTEQADHLLIYAMVATVIGARAGHYFFYEFPLLQSDPVRFFTQMIIPPYSGLASHGAGIGLFTAFYLYSRKYPGQSYLYVTDRVVPTVALGGFFIRMGNLMNSEIVGKPTDLPWGFKFYRDTEFNAMSNAEVLARHPSQLYEALSCLVLFFVIMWYWSKKKEKTTEGVITGWFMIVLFGLRFMYEFLKENQSEFENTMTLNMGQILSIPAMLFGLAVLLYSKKQHSTH